MQYFVVAGVIAVTLSSSAYAQSLLDNVPLMPRSSTCQAVATAQNRGCEVENIFRCTGGGLQYWRIEEHTVYELEFIVLKDPALGSFGFGDPSARVEARIVTRGSTAVSLNELISTGHGESKQTGYFSVFGIQKPVSATSRASVEDTIVISGVPLVSIRYDDIVVFPAPLGPVNGISYNYYHAESGILFGGESTDPFSGAPDDLTISGRPAEIYWPGSPGFGSTTPSYDCGEFSLNLPVVAFKPKDAS
jgi:hypothetical protein